MKASLWLYGLFFVLWGLTACTGNAQEIVLAKNGRSDYKIVIPKNPSAIEQHAAAVLQGYIQRVSGAELQVVKEEKGDNSRSIYIGHTTKGNEAGRLGDGGSIFRTDDKDLVFSGGGKGLIYGVYAFIEEYLGCKKLNSEPALIAPQKKIKISSHIYDEHKPQFVYREVYYPASHDTEYQEWHQLQQLDYMGGIWGHSFNKLVPAQTYFAGHPEYYSQVNGKRVPSQLCLNNEDVFNIVVNELKKRMAKDPDASYWSISPNDDGGYCQCDKCKATDNLYGGPSGSLIKFVNRVAAVFPNQKFTTLAYGYAHKAPRNLKPADNVYVFISDIDAYRDKPLSVEGSALAFRTDLKAWSSVTANLFIWDYIVEFTNYLAPFPNLQTLGANIHFLKSCGVKGIFEQGSGDTYGEWAELRSYVTAKLLEDDKADPRQLISSFLQDYYGDAGRYLQQYIDLQQDNLIASNHKLDIYGNPINEWKSYLSPEFMDQYNALFDNAAAAVAGDSTLLGRINRARLPLEYTALQMARLYGIEKNGFIIKDKNGNWGVSRKFADRLTRFVSDCKKAGVTELAEAGLRPDQYQEEWNRIFAEPVIPTKALGAPVSLQYPFAPEYPAKGNLTLTDGNCGYTDFSYNYLCFYGVPMVANIDLGKTIAVNKVIMHFLDDPRHWIFKPVKITVEVSSDGAHYHTISSPITPANNEDDTLSVKEYTILNKAHLAEQIRYVRVTANNLPKLPSWRYREGKRPMIACDEIYVQ